MTLNDYIEKLQKLVLDNPENGELEVRYASDDEGNYNYPVFHDPGIFFIQDSEIMDEVYPDSENPENFEKVVLIN